MTHSNTYLVARISLSSCPLRSTWRKFVSRLQTLTFEHDQFQRLNMGSKVTSAYSEKCPACVDLLSQIRI